MNCVDTDLPRQPEGPRSTKPPLVTPDLIRGPAVARINPQVNEVSATPTSRWSLVQTIRPLSVGSLGPGSGSGVMVWTAPASGIDVP